MILVLFFELVLVSCLPLICFATYHNTTSMPICHKSFSCNSDLAPFKYPFYNASESSECGLIKVHCNTTTSNVTQIQLGNQSYQIKGRPSPGSSVWVRNTRFEELVKANRCEALDYNFTSPTPLLFSISIQTFITLYKCTNHSNYAHTFFHQHNYTRYECKGHNFYYQYSFKYAEVPRDVLNQYRCQIIQLPKKVGHKVNEINIFSLLSSDFSLLFQLTPSCTECNITGGHCNTHNGRFQCSLAKKGNPGRKMRLIITGSVLILLLSAVVFAIWRHCKSRPFSYVSSKEKAAELEDGSHFFGVSVFTYAELKDATQNFDHCHELGDGGFGAVYYGKLQDGREVAVKRLYKHNYKRVQQFINEVEILAKLRHPNLVLLYGCTSTQSHDLLLVYEYIPNGTVADHLHGPEANPSLLTWPIRMNIAIETASALAYLHATEIIHRDVKTNNILLDHNFCVKVADFGLSRLLPNDVTHVSTAPQGTPGYVDPQYHQRYQLTDKSDVYSFGVVLVELISSLVAVDLSRSSDDISLANLAINRIQRFEVDQLIDPVLGSDSDSEITRMTTLVAELAFRCLQYDSEMRPTMSEVLEVLENIQGTGRTYGYDGTKESKHLDPPVSLETIKDTVVLLGPSPSTPISVGGDWQSGRSGSSNTLSSSGDGLPKKNHMSI
ncbi:hypothetical protein OSB04_021956 [Centaurea solstitialis]|uniref:Protein kinase domain-containing protein n=1 Tax=Centaurea solstitialis TaxID=347529 RepID=A0AA38TEZ7_9ASTR|nr:hypothetical protein OSB04_021956 [Centaurea solstitialis]